MEMGIGAATVHYVEHGDGVPLVGLHGAGVDHREIEAALEAILPESGCRRIYPDLPGMGRTTAEGLTGNDDVVALLAEFSERLRSGPVLLVGHSYGGYLARGLAAQRPDVVAGLALLCPLSEVAGDVPRQRVVRQDVDAYDALDDADRAGFDGYFVVRTAATARRYREAVLPGTRVVDTASLERIFADWSIDIGPDRFEAPALIVAGRLDSTVGYTDVTELLPRYPRATLAVIDDVGHALMHERPELVGALLGDWLERSRT